MSRSPHPYWHVDAFAARPFTGNQAAVMPLDEWLPDETLVAIAAENNFAETAFLVPDATGEADYELRWFTPTVEVALCGHATLASGHVLLSQGGAAGVGAPTDRVPADRVTFRTRRSGLLWVARAGRDREAYEMALPATQVAPREEPALLAALGAAGEVFVSVGGAQDIAVVLLESEAAVRALAPDMRALAGVAMMAICTARAGPDGPAGPGGGPDVVSRVFVPAWGVDEDPVTGAAHAALTPFWTQRLGRDSFTAYQASARGGHLTCRLEGEGDDARAVLGGSCVTVVEGRFFLPG